MSDFRICVSSGLESCLGDVAEALGGWAEVYCVSDVDDGVAGCNAFLADLSSGGRDVFDTGFAIGLGKFVAVVRAAPGVDCDLCSRVSASGGFVFDTFSDAIGVLEGEVSGF